MRTGPRSVCSVLGVDPLRTLAPCLVAPGGWPRWSVLSACHAVSITRPATLDSSPTGPGDLVGLKPPQGVLERLLGQQAGEAVGDRLRHLPLRRGLRGALLRTPLGLNRAHGDWGIPSAGRPAVATKAARPSRGSRLRRPRRYGTAVASPRPHTLHRTEPRQAVEAFAQRGPSDRQGVDAVRLAAIAASATRLAHQLGRHPDDAFPAGQQKPLKGARHVPAVLKRPGAIVAEAARPIQQRDEAGLAVLDRLVTQRLAGRRGDRRDGV